MGPRSWALRAGILQRGRTSLERLHQAQEPEDTLELPSWECVYRAAGNLHATYEGTPASETVPVEEALADDEGNGSGGTERSPVDTLRETKALVGAGGRRGASAGTGGWVDNGTAGTTEPRGGETGGVSTTSDMVEGTGRSCRGTHSIEAWAKCGGSCMSLSLGAFAACYRLSMV